jgi:transcriptional regulator with XRE-family HTH domain
MNTDNWALGQKLYQFRIKAGYTLSEVAMAMSFSSAFLSMVENGRCGISFSNLSNLLGFYNKTFHDLADNPNQDDRVVSLINAKKIRLEDTEKGANIYSLTNKSGNNGLNPIYLRLEPGATINLTVFKGEGFCHVLEGVIKIKFEDKSADKSEDYILEKGDSINFESNLTNSWQNPEDHLAIALLVFLNQ